MNIKKRTDNQEEVDKFSKMASEWWDPNGKFAPLHKFNPIRQEYLVDKILIRENRMELANHCFKFLKHRVTLDLAGWNNQDIFAH